MGARDPLGQASIGYLAKIHDQVGLLAGEASLTDVDDFTRSWHILMKGTIISATEGDAGATRRAQRMTRAGVWSSRPNRHLNQAGFKKSPCPLTPVRPKHSANATAARRSTVG